MLKRKLKVLQITLDNGVGGLSKVMLEIIKNLNGSIFSSSVYYFKEFPETFLAELEEHNIPFFSSQSKNGKTNYLNFIELKRFLDKNKFDIVHTHNTPAFIDGMLAASLSNVPVRIHTDHARLFPDKRRYMLMEWLISKVTTKIVAVSDHTRRELIKFEKINPDDIVVIPNGVDYDFSSFIKIEAKKSEMGLEDRSPVLGLGARLVEQKGITYLLQAMPQVLAQYPKAILLIAGDGPLRRELELEAQELNISHAVRFLGFRLDIHNLLKLFDVYVLPSLWEGLPMAILEAMALKKSIVATAVGGTPMAILNGKTGLLVPPRQPQLLADAILRLCRDQVFATKLGEEAYQYYHNEFTINKMVSRYEKLYWDCLKRKKII